MAKERLTAGSLFSGIGGIDLGLERAGFEVAWQSEIDPYACQVLSKHWPHVKNLGDIRDVREVSAVDLICGGFPCQDVSCAGKGAGLEGQQSLLWFEMLRVISIARPRWCLIENSPALRIRGMDRIYAGLEAAGYSVWPFVVGASDVGAPHRRQRAWIVAHTDQQHGDCTRHGPGSILREQREETQVRGSEAADAVRRQFRDQPGRRPESNGTGSPFPDVPGQKGITSHPSLPGCADAGGKCQSSSSPGRSEPDANAEGLPERRLVRVVHGVPPEMDGDGVLRFAERRPWSRWPDISPIVQGKQANRRQRIRCLGNTVIPQIVEAIGRAILRVDLAYDSLP